jgi:hypothetical protein
MQNNAFVIVKTSDADQSITYFDGSFFGSIESTKLYFDKQEARGEAGRLQYGIGDGTVTAKTVALQIPDLATVA